MIIVGCDFHTRFQQVAMLDPTTGEIVERRLVKGLTINARFAERP